MNLEIIKNPKQSKNVRNPYVWGGSPEYFPKK
jgi:hypothetical protein